MNREEMLEKGQQIRSAMDLQDLMKEGSMSSSLEFVRALTDSVTEKNRVIGFVFRNSEDISFFERRLKPDFKNLMDYELGDMIFKPAGSEFIVNIAEMCEILSKVEFAGTTTGGNIVARLSGKEVTTRNGSYMLPILVLETTDGSRLKDHSESIHDDEGNILPPYQEKFGVVLGRKQNAREARDETSKNMAAAFRSMYNETY